MTDHDDLIEAVLSWWKEHENDASWDGEDERNTYDEVPEFVEIAMKLAGWKK